MQTFWNTNNGGNYGIYYSSNVGQNWLPLISGLSAKTNSLFSIDTVLFAGTSGDGVYKINLSTVGINNNSEVNLKEFQLFQNYPNPFNPITKIEFELTKQSSISLIVYNIRGETVKELIKNYLKNQGKHTFDFDRSNLPSGVYFYELSTSSFKQIRTMLLIK